MELAPPVILYESGPCLIVAKPAGLPTQAPRGIESLELRIKHFLRDRTGKATLPYLAIPHRLDRPVSGTMVFALHSRAAKKIGRQFEARTVRKTYWACVEGTVLPAAGRWEDHLRKIPDVPRGEVVPADHPEGRVAVLNYRTLGHTALGSWLEIELETGRMHQIRIQAASRGFPIIGDEQYGAQHTFGPRHEDFRLRPIALHGHRLALDHPMTGEPIDICQPPPSPWETLAAVRTTDE